MWFIGQSILAYIIKDSTKEKEIEKLLKKRMSLIKIEVNNLKDEEIVNYLLHPKMPDEIKKLIGEKITELEKSIFSTEHSFIRDLFCLEICTFCAVRRWRHGCAASARRAALIFSAAGRAGRRIP